MAADLIVTVGKIAVALGVVLGLGVPCLGLAERRLSAAMQGRAGPRRWLQPLADGVKLLVKEEPVPPAADRPAYALAPVAALVPALAILAAIPFGDTVTVMGRTFKVQIAALDAGAVYVLAASGMGVYAALLAGWGSGDKFAALGGLRAVAQQVSFSACLGLALVGVFLVHGSLRLDEIVLEQAQGRWNLWRQPLGFVIFLIGILAWGRPFDLDTGAGELVAGWRSRYGGVKFALLAAADRARLIAGAALVVALYGGGWNLPYVTAPGPGPQWMDLVKVATFGLKVALLLVFLVWVRWSLPRLRYDQAMRLAWKRLLPLAALNAAGTGLFVFLIS